MIKANEVVEIQHLRIGNILEYKGRLVHVTMLSLDIDTSTNYKIFISRLLEPNFKYNYDRHTRDTNFRRGPAHHFLKMRLPAGEISG